MAFTIVVDHSWGDERLRFFEAHTRKEAVATIKNCTLRETEDVEEYLNNPDPSKTLSSDNGVVIIREVVEKSRRYVMARYGYVDVTA